MKKLTNYIDSFLNTRKIEKSIIQALLLSINIVNPLDHSVSIDI